MRLKINWTPADHQTIDSGVLAKREKERKKARAVRNWILGNNLRNLLWDFSSPYQSELQGILVAGEAPVNEYTHSLQDRPEDISIARNARIGSVGSVKVVGPTRHYSGGWARVGAVTRARVNHRCYCRLLPSAGGNGEHYTHWAGGIEWFLE